MSKANRSRICAVIAFAAIVAPCAIWGKSVVFSVQWPLYEGLRQTAAIVFGVMGAWIAIIYPGAMGKLLKRQGGREQYDTLRKLLRPMVTSTAILAAVLLVGLAAPLLRQWPFLIQNIGVFRAISFAFLGVLTALQLITVVLMLVPVDALESSMEAEVERQDLIGKLTSVAQRDTGKRSGAKSSENASGDSQSRR